MPDYVLMTDSSCDLSAEMIEEMGLIVLPLTFHIGEESYYNYPDWRELSPEHFYEKIRAGALVSTSAVNMEAFRSAMQRELDSGKDIFYLGFSSALSGTYQSACMAAEELRPLYPQQNIVTIDSRSASLGQGLLLYLLWQQKKKGLSLQELAEYAEAEKPHICHWFTVDDLHHLARGGRLSATGATIGSILSIKPVLHTDDAGCLIPMSKARHRRNALQALLDRMKNAIIEPETQTCFICHSNCLEDAELMARRMKDEIGVKEVIINWIGPVIGAHTGERTLGIFYRGTSR